LDAIDAAVDAGQSLADAIAEFRSKYVNQQKGEAEKAIAYFKAGAPQTVRQQINVKKLPTKKQVQKIIDKAYAVGMGFGKQQGFQKGATEGQKSGFVTGKEVGIEQGQEMGIKEGKLAAAKTMKVLLEGLKAELNPRQINALLDKLAKQRNFTPEGKQAFIDYANNVIDDANYVLNERAGNKLKGRVKTMSQSDQTPANDKSLFIFYCYYEIFFNQKFSISSINSSKEILGFHPKIFLISVESPFKKFNSSGRRNFSS
jgi:hypothetical protein